MFSKICSLNINNTPEYRGLYQSTDPQFKLPPSAVHYFNTSTVELGMPPGVEVVWRLEERRCFEFNFFQTLPLDQS